jgi:hypothetical protein
MMVFWWWLNMLPVLNFCRGEYVHREVVQQVSQCGEYWQSSLDRAAT